MKQKIITIFGSGRIKENSAMFSLACELGRLCAQAGFAIANGGYNGSMLASAKGARQAGGRTIGVTCAAFGKTEANEFISETIITQNLTERVARLCQLGDAYVVLPGGTGTLLELAEIWENANKGFVNPPKPIILIGDFWKPLVEMMAKDDPRSSSYISLAETAQTAIQILKEKLK
ncbi:MAG TPA: LOG family protein [Anaerohalosphaeraceae bacterium]|nr:LOG family protein [Anaerohalosphaeraceae bacterium]